MTIDVDEVGIFPLTQRAVLYVALVMNLRETTSLHEKRVTTSPAPGHRLRRSKAEPSTLLRTQKDPFTPAHALLPDTDHKVVVDPVTVLLHMAIPTRSTLISTVI